MTDYFMPPTCRACHGILDIDGNHWASGKADCSTVAARVSDHEEGAAVRMMLEMGIEPAEVATMTMDARKRRGY